MLPKYVICKESYAYDNPLSDFEYVVDEKTRNIKMFESMESALKIYKQLKLEPGYVIGMINQDGTCCPLKCI